MNTRRPGFAELCAYLFANRQHGHVDTQCKKAHTEYQQNGAYKEKHQRGQRHGRNSDTEEYHDEGDRHDGRKRFQSLLS